MSVETSTLEARLREDSGKGSARKLRAQGLIPAVIYGKGLAQPTHIAVDPLQVKKAIATPHRFNTLIQLKLAGGAGQQVLLKDYQQDPVSRQVLHVDFLGVSENQPVKVKIPVVLVGKAEGVVAGGVLSQLRRELELHALAQAIPERLEVDVSNLKINEALHVNDLTLPEGVTIKTHVNYTIAVISAPEAETAPQAGAAPAAAAAPAKAAPAKAEAKKEEKKK